MLYPSPSFPSPAAIHSLLSTTKHSTLVSRFINERGAAGNITTSIIYRAFNNTKSLSSSSPVCVVHASQKDSEQFEVDPEKAKEALQKLDQQLQTLSKKQVNTPKIRASDVKLARDEMIEDDSPEISGSFLSYLTIALLAFTIFYNVLFYSVIKPSIDGPDSAPQPQTESTSGATVLQ